MANYAIDFEYISEVLCINKNKPKSKCNGKCHLAKQLKANTPISSNEPVKAINVEVEFLFYFFSEQNMEESPFWTTSQNTFPDLKENVLFRCDKIPVPPPLYS